MKQDEQLKKILASYAVEQTGDDFTDKTMQRINSFAVNRSTSSTSKNSYLKYWIIGLLILVIVALVIASLFIKPLQVPVQIQIELPPFVAHHFYHFFILIPAFWILVFINHTFERKVRM